MRSGGLMSYPRVNDPGRQPIEPPPAERRVPELLRELARLVVAESLPTPLTIPRDHSAALRAPGARGRGVISAADARRASRRTAARATRASPARLASGGGATPGRGRGRRRGW